MNPRGGGRDFLPKGLESQHEQHLVPRLVQWPKEGDSMLFLWQHTWSADAASSQPLLVCVLIPLHQGYVGGGEGGGESLRLTYCIQILLALLRFVLVRTLLVHSEPKWSHF